MKHGTKVKITKKLVRESQRKHTGKFWQRWKIWKPVEYCSEGIFLGYRTVQDGTTDWEDEVGMIFMKKSCYKVALVSPSAKENPIYVPLENMRECLL